MRFGSRSRIFPFFSFLPMDVQLLQHYLLERLSWEFSSSPMVGSPRVHCQVPGFNPWSGELRSCKLRGTAKKCYPSIELLLHFCQKSAGQDFAGGTVVKNPPANAGDTGSIPGPGRSHMPRSNWACAPQLLKPARLEPVPPRWEARTLQRRVAPARRN